MASKRKSTTPCMVLASEQDLDLEMISDLEVGPLVQTPAHNAAAESISSDEEIQDYTDSDNQQNKVEGGYECKYCSFQTPDLNMFTFHVDSEHPTVVLNSSYVCIECNFLTKRYDALSEHNIKYHPGEENFKLSMVKRNNQTIFEQTVNDLIFDGIIVHEENQEQSEAAVSGISISKTPIMKMMKNKAENKRIAVSHNVVDDIPAENEMEVDHEREQEEEVIEPALAVSESVQASSPVVTSAQETSTTVVAPATVLQSGLAHVITTIQAQQNSNLGPKVLIPVNSIPAYNSALDNHPLLLNSYNRFPYPTVSEITVLSTQAKYTEEQIKIWFSAQRLKHGVSWTPEEVEEARRKQFNGTVHTVPQTITVIPAQISTAGNGLPSILQTCQIVGQPGLVLTQVAGANTLPVTTPIALTVSGVPSQTQLQTGHIQTPQPIAETKHMAAVPAPQLSKHDSSQMNVDSFNMRAKKTKEQLAALKLSYLKTQFPLDAEIDRLIKLTGLTKSEIKKWFSDTRYNQRNSKSSHGMHFMHDSNSTIIIDSSDEMSESSTVITSQRKQTWNAFPDFTLQKFKEKTSEQLQALEDSFLKSPVPTDEELSKLRAETKLTRREIDAWFSEKRKSKGLKEEQNSNENNINNVKGEKVENSPGNGGAVNKSKNFVSNKISKKSPEQLHVLKGAFVRTQWPSAEEYDRLAEETGLLRSDIVSWFGDTRYAWKNGNLKWYYYYQYGSGDASTNVMNGQTFTRRRGRGRPRSRGRGRPRGRPKGRRVYNWDRVSTTIKFKTGKSILKDYYLKHKFLNEQDLDELVAKSHMGYEQVREWFAERLKREEAGLEPFEENEENEDDEDNEDHDEEEENEETDDSDTWEPPRHVRRRMSKTDD
uniref:Zinc fingers and homeoboxes protein 1 n=1 Tax=Geotrypetes seraphini TaxID=260995 RepID=A0A6P8QQ29_GEOSA|nr:zinc fingers and homeoboxes protein 1 [Geotrypetes seraphini]XP_033789629.1 zinc fingers and homeoboxes protein 1 [Geotrypetes seraphini]XP_033789631.1 zinc fingers and homeoboxes protein 1 [Geotrypetes seraphini]XP_033789632.1 zinc fingers and homeoboxes protein 1 [Geotrypetes seraphini]XP_033789633.1 zinc fingers and homeoboxes protein 1 [Geotrypetes seraphini]